MFTFGSPQVLFTLQKNCLLYFFLNRVCCSNSISWNVNANMIKALLQMWLKIWYKKSFPKNFYLEILFLIVEHLDITNGHDQLIWS